MHLHILGICGTFMGSLALLAREQGHRVTGCDANVYPPMSTQLQAQGIELIEGYDVAQLSLKPDVWVIGNALSRGNPLVEAILNHRLHYMSGPQWLAETILPGRWVIGVAGTHGKTTTTTIVAWILEQAGLAPGFLIGGVPQGFPVSARLGSTPFFVVEADEYDSAFFDKRSKFVHYRPTTAILNNLEYDHADIFPDVAAIQAQFNHLIRTIPGAGLILCPPEDPYLAEVLQQGCWTPVTYFSAQSNSTAEWQVRLLAADASHFEVLHQGELQGQVQWRSTGMHNVHNALAALLAARHVGVAIKVGIEALNHFSGVKRRMELLAEVAGIRIYDDFAHHPTAIATTLDGLYHQQQQGHHGRIIALIEPRSNTMRLGVHQQQLAEATKAADVVLWFKAENVQWDLAAQVSGHKNAQVFSIIDEMIAAAVVEVKPTDQIVIMSNGGFGGIHQKLVNAVRLKFS